MDRRSKVIIMRVQYLAAVLPIQELIKDARDFTKAGIITHRGLDDYGLRNL